MEIVFSFLPTLFIEPSVNINKDDVCIFLQDWVLIIEKL